MLQLWLQVAAVPFIWSSFLQVAANRQPFYTAFQAELTSLEALPSSMQVPAVLPGHQQQQQQQHVVPQHGPAPADLKEFVGAEVARAVHAVYGQALDLDVPLVQAGLDSLGASWRLVPYGLSCMDPWLDCKQLCLVCMPADSPATMPYFSYPSPLASPGLDGTCRLGPSPEDEMSRAWLRRGCGGQERAEQGAWIGAACHTDV